MRRGVVVAAALLVVLAAVAGGIYFIYTNPVAPSEKVARGPEAAKQPEPVPEKKPQPPEVTAEPKLIDEVVFTEEPNFAKAIDMIEAGKLDLYANGTTDPSLVQEIRDSDALDEETSYGGVIELTLNPVGPTFPATGKLNPFSDPAIREALNWLINRKYIADEIYGSLAVPKFFPLNTAFPDYARLADVARALEIRYAYDPEKAQEIIAAEMKKLGAQLVDGIWRYNGEPVKLIFLIRTEDERRDVGDYVSNLLEDLGFVVDRQYKTSAEAAPLWISGDPAEGKWNLYTGGWIFTVISRDQAGLFNGFYTPRGRSSPLWQAYRPAEEFDEVADRLARRDYQTLAERRELMTRAMELGLKDSVRVFLVDTLDTVPRRAELTLTADLAGGINGSWLWPYTMRFTEGSRSTVNFGSPTILNDPWNPIAGSNWIYDTMIVRSTGELALLPDPFTGLYWPQRIEKAEVTVEQGLPVAKTHDWVKLDFAPSIAVPADAWVDWDAESQRFLTVDESYPEGLTAKTKTVVYYDENLFQMKWHDGSRMSLADLVMSFILTFDRAKEESPIFDEAYVPDFETFQGHFKGLRIVQEDPLVVEVYSDQIFPDAELIVSSRASYLYPYYSQGPAPWHSLAIGILAETNNELAFSSGKADQLKVEWMNYIAGPSLEILDKYRQQALEQGSVPYENTLGRYISAEEAQGRYAALGDWYEQRGHFWVGQGPFYLESVYTVEKIITVRRSEVFPDAPDKWIRFSEPRIAKVEVSGPKRVEVGAGVEFQVNITFAGDPYPAEDVKFVKFLVVDARGELALVGDAAAVGNGVWRISLTREQTAGLAVGSNRLEVVVASKVVSLPVFAAATFVSIQP